MQMDLSHYSVPVSMIRQYLFCSRIPYFNEVLKVNPSDRLWQFQGINHHDRQEMLNKRRKLSKFGVAEGKIEFQVQLNSKPLGIHGICDAIVFSENTTTPLEFKLEKNKPSKGHIYQIVAYGLLVEARYKTVVENCFILYGEKGKSEVVVMNQWREKVLTTFEKLREVIDRSIMPHTSASEAQCSQCEYQNFCADRY